MKRKLIAVLAVALIAALGCGVAFAATGDITIKDAKAYADASMTQYVGTIPAGTSLMVRSYDNYADVYVNGKIVYISKSALLDGDIAGPYNATLTKGTRVYQRATTSANSVKVKKTMVVNVCAIDGDWALVRTTDDKAVFAYVKLDKLTKIEIMN